MEFIDKLVEQQDAQKRKYKARSLKQKKCLGCGDSFRPRTRQQKNNPFCSAVCSQSYSR